MAEHIQIGDVSPRVQHIADGTLDIFTYSFPVFSDSDMEVYVGDALKTVDTDYAVTGAGDSAGGTVVFTAPPGAGELVTLRRFLPVQRTTDFRPSGDFRAETVNDELDRQTAFIQQVEDDVARSLRLSPTDPSADLVLPDKASRANTYLAFDAAGAPVTAVDVGGYPASAFMATVLDDADAAAARATLGAEAVDADILRADLSDTLAVGFTASSFDAGTVSGGTFTPTIANGQFQHLTIGGNFTLDLPSDAAEGALEIEATVDATGGYTVTVDAGYAAVSGVVDTTANAVNRLRVTKHESKTTLEVVNLS